MVGGPPADARLAPPERRGLPVGLVEPLRAPRERLRSTSAARPEDRHVLRRVEPNCSSRQLQSPLRMLTGQLELAAMNGDHGDRKVILRHLEAVLDRDVVGGCGVGRLRAPSARPRTRPRRGPRVRGRFAARRARATPRCSRSSSVARLVPGRRRRAACSRSPASPPARAADRRRRPRSRACRLKSRRAPPRRRRTSRGSLAPLERAHGARRRRAARRARARRERGRVPPLEARRPREAAVDGRLKRGRDGGLPQRFFEQRDGAVDALELGEQDERLGTQRADPGLRQQIRRDRPAHASTRRLCDAREQRRAHDGGAHRTRRRGVSRSACSASSAATAAAPRSAARPAACRARRQRRRPAISVDSAR